MFSFKKYQCSKSEQIYEMEFMYIFNLETWYPPNLKVSFAEWNDFTSCFHFIYMI